MKSGIIVITFLSMVLSNQAKDRVYETQDGVRFTVETVLGGLDVPWSIVFDPSGNMIFTERSGNLNILKKGSREHRVIGSIDDVVQQGEGGLMGLALHPDFASNGLLYVSHTYRARGSLANRVVRYRLAPLTGQGKGALSERKVIIAYLPGSAVHNGCRLRFGRDRKLYVTAGDAAERDQAQDPSSLGGKILRINDDGSVPKDNPDPSSAIFASGVRNPQGIDWHPTAGLLFETEHGPSGFDGPGGGDEVNIIEAGQNYGWPVIHHREKKSGYRSPLLEYTPAVAPASGMFYSGSLFPKFRNNFFFGGLRGTRIQRVVLDEKDPRKVVREEELLLAVFGRIREVAEGPDGAIYFSTSNTSRGRSSDDDDRILRLVPVK